MKDKVVKTGKQEDILEQLEITNMYIISIDNFQKSAQLSNDYKHYYCAGQASLFYLIKNIRETRSLGEYHTIAGKLRRFQFHYHSQFF